jgi:hypothetical protein
MAADQTGRPPQRKPGLMNGTHGRNAFRGLWVSRGAQGQRPHVSEAHTKSPKGQVGLTILLTQGLRELPAGGVEQRVPVGHLNRCFLKQKRLLFRQWLLGSAQGTAAARVTLSRNTRTARKRMSRGFGCEAGWMQVSEEDYRKQRKDVRSSRAHKVSMRSESLPTRPSARRTQFMVQMNEWHLGPRRRVEGGSPGESAAASVVAGGSPSPWAVPCCRHVEQSN